MTGLSSFFSEDPNFVVDPLWDDLAKMIRQKNAANPRHLQVELGPSEVGHPCMRRMAYGLMQVPRCNPEYDPLPSIFGTAMHTWLQSAAEYANEQLGRERWLTETRVTPILGLTGSSDLYDTDTNSVIDWKGVSLDTSIPTPSGWATMGELQVGDRVLDADGLPTTIVKMSPVFTERDCYRITFEDDVTVVCDDVHEWNVQFGQDSRARTMTAPEMLAKLRCPRGQSQIRVANNEPLDLPGTELPIEPYLFGAWLGDGEKNSGVIHKPDVELFNRIELNGGVTSLVSIRAVDCRKVRIEGLTKKLRIAGLLGNKHIPMTYLRASHRQRLELMRGLMDTDGSYNKIRNQGVFTTIDKSFAHQFAELVTTLGWKPRVWELEKTGFGKTITAYDITFTPFEDNPFHLPRKADLVKVKGTTRSRRRFIRTIEKVETVATRCITVDSPSNTFLCTDAMIPTHNCLGYTSYDKYKANMSLQYKGQLTLYGKGFRNAGYPVKRIAIAILPRSGTLTKMHLWKEDYDDDFAERILARRESVITMIDDLNVDVDPNRYHWIPIQPETCGFCPWYRPESRTALQCSGKS